MQADGSLIHPWIRCIHDILNSSGFRIDWKIKQFAVIIFSMRLIKTKCYINNLYKNRETRLNIFILE